MNKIERKTKRKTHRKVLFQPLKVLLPIVNDELANFSAPRDVQVRKFVPEEQQQFPKLRALNDIEGLTVCSTHRRAEESATHLVVCNNKIDQCLLKHVWGKLRTWWTHGGKVDGGLGQVRRGSRPAAGWKLILSAIFLTGINVLGLMVMVHVIAHVPVAGLQLVNVGGDKRRIGWVSESSTKYKMY